MTSEMESVHFLDHKSTRMKMPVDSESKNSRSHSDMLRQLPIRIVLKLASLGLNNMNEEEKQKCIFKASSTKMKEQDDSDINNQTIENFETTMKKLQSLVITKNDQYKKAESENRIWKTEKLALKSTIDDLKYQLQFRNYKNKTVKTEDVLKLKKKLKDYEKKLLKMKQQSLQNDSLQFEIQIEKTLTDLNEFCNHWRNPSPKLLYLVKVWKDAKHSLPMRYSDAKASLSNHLKTLEKGKDVPDFDSILSNSIAFQLPETPNFLQLTHECQQLESSSSFVPTGLAGESSSNWGDTDYHSMSADSSGSLTRSVIINQVVNILLSMDLGTSKEELITLTENFIKSNPQIAKLDPDDISAEVLLYITSGM